MKYNKGFTMIELLVTMAILGGISTLKIKETIAENKKVETYKLMDQAYSIVEAVDRRISIDGYEPTNWQQEEWLSETDIVENLINKELVSQYSTTCLNGEWTPLINSERMVKIIDCGLWETRKDTGENFSANFTIDGSGFIQKFDLLMDFDATSSYFDNFLNIKYSINKLKNNIGKEITGIHSVDMVDKTSRIVITSHECISDLPNCGILFSLNRSGGNEYVRVDGENSMIASNLTFVDTIGQSALKCQKWENEYRDGTGLWTLNPEVNCGVGIYKNTGDVMSIEAVADNGTFRNVLLNKTCIVYQTSGNSVADLGKRSPCGILEDSGVIYQVIDNVSADTAVFNNLQTAYSVSERVTSANVAANTMDITVANIERIISPLINASVVKISNELNVSGTANLSSTSVNGTLVSYGNSIFQNGTIFEGATLFNDHSHFKSSAQVDGNLSSKTLNVNNGLIANGESKINKAVVSYTMNVATKTANSSCSNKSGYGLITVTSSGDLMTCKSNKWVIFDPNE